MRLNLEQQRNNFVQTGGGHKEANPKFLFDQWQRMGYRRAIIDELKIINKCPIYVFRSLTFSIM